MSCSSSDLIDRKYSSLYIGNLSVDIRRKDLSEYLEEFDRVDQCEIFEANHRRWNCFAFVLMRTADSINRLMSTRPHFLHNRRLFLKRALPSRWSNKIEHFLISKNLLIQLKNPSNEEKDFNEENIRIYFQTYGNLVNLFLLKNHRCVIEFSDYDAVDCILLDAPHYFNSFEIQIEKFYPQDQLKHIERMFVHPQPLPMPGPGEDEQEVEEYLRSRRFRLMRIRLLNESILAIQISNEIQYETIDRGFLSTIKRRKELFERIEFLTRQCQTLREKNFHLEQHNRNLFRTNQQLEKEFQEEISNEQIEINRWKEKIRLMEK